ncbi:hypothetical protein SAMN05421541_103227 [Actinoplanes philippinensis]|uniref:DUF1963 domain-containing protein n=1 Tax=Actinoplanes philippinensis TaxID=35752 RepID=A0A1I2CVF3_9ACTN|nr:hypothetical protein [Actinoplanes philippinensis]SFE72244.1 hypothetical protein SAMN05421541_103227 [Actinoplanes philippinensis]
MAKLGGQPYWLDEPFWPVSATFRRPMVFVGQFPLPGPPVRMGYLFIADDPNGRGLTMEPEEGDNALLVQPGGRVPGFVRGLPRATGPSLWRRGARRTDRVPVELRVTAAGPVGSGAGRVAVTAAGPVGADRFGWVGGRPRGWRSDFVELLDDSWRFFFQIDGAEGIDGDAYALNFGGGTGYAFLSRDEREGRFFWDCA